MNGNVFKMCSIKSKNPFFLVSENVGDRGLGYALASIVASG